MNNLSELISNTEFKPRFHGNGFTQLYLNKDQRLHVWHPDLPALRDHNAMIHNHRFLLKSKILSGKIEHITYDVLNDPFYQTHNIVMIEGASKSREANFVHKGTARLDEKHRYVLAAGSEYNFKAGLFHTSTPVTDIAVTLMTKENDPSVGWASLATLIGTIEPTHAFTPATQPSEEKLWSVINEALNTIHE